MLVVLVTFGVICHVQMPRPDTSDVESGETKLSSCQALLGAVRAKEAKDVVRLAAIPPSSRSDGAIEFARPSLAFACADCMSTDSPCRAGPSALVGKNTSGLVQPADGAQYPESSATSCAARLRECRAHSIRARRRSTSPGTLSPSHRACPIISTNI
jgi:hypothetical protein